MKKFSSNNVKLIGAIVSLSMIVTACSVDYNLLSEGIKDLGGAVSGSEETTVATTESSVPEETEQSETVPETTPAPTATPVPTATPTPMPERVDFSELTKDEITEDFTVNKEAFEEHFVEEGTETTLAHFKGDRVLVSMPNNNNVQTAINLYLDSFYQKALGEYQAAIQEAKADYTLNQAVIEDDVKTVSIIVKYSDNGRIASFVMEKNIQTNNEMVESTIEVVSFDILTGQIVSLNTIAKNPSVLIEALKQDAIPNMVTIDNPDATETQNTETNTINIKPEDIVDVYVIAQKPGAQTVTAEILGITANGDVVCNTVDMSKYADFLNSFGKIAYGI